MTEEQKQAIRLAMDGLRWLYQEYNLMPGFHKNELIAALAELENLLRQ